MRARLVVLCSVFAFAASLPLAPAADAQKGKRADRPAARSYGYQSYQPPRRAANPGPQFAPAPGDSTDCIRARDADPAGNYAGYPCWAQWALSPKGRNR